MIAQLTTAVAIAFALGWLAYERPSGYLRVIPLWQRVAYGAFLLASGWNLAVMITVSAMMGAVDHACMGAIESAAAGITVPYFSVVAWCLGAVLFMEGTKSISRQRTRSP